MRAWKKAIAAVYRIAIPAVQEVRECFSYDVLVIRDLHTPPREDPFQELKPIKQVTYTQFNILRSLWAKPETILFCEGITKSLTQHDHAGFCSQLTAVLPAIGGAFDQSIPRRYKRLSTQQKKVLSMLSAHFILYHNRKLPILFAAEDERVHEAALNYANSFDGIRHGFFGLLLFPSFRGAKLRYLLLKFEWTKVEVENLTTAPTFLEQPIHFGAIFITTLFYLSHKTNQELKYDLVTHFIERTTLTEGHNKGELRYSQIEDITSWFDKEMFV